ncbi:MAG TPA: hypothetical protein VFP58_08270 [Candidatus Eisenbacteria bacterium]|nr:hypothetical protein [Candidatus Eisenbacteria bacterium]
MMGGRTAHRVATGVLSLLVAACTGAADREPVEGRSPSPGATPSESGASERERAAHELASLLLDTQLHELRATLAFKIRNPDRHDESPLRDSILPPGPPPGPHQFDGTVFAELETLRRILPPGPRVRVEGDVVYVGDPEVLIHGHRHGAALFVPVKLFARQFGAYTDVTGTLATMAIVWTPEILRYMRAEGPRGSTGLLEAYAEGLIDSVDVRARPEG